MARSPQHTGRGTGHGGRASVGKRQSHNPPITGSNFPTQGTHFQDPHYPFQPLPAPNGPAPYRFDLSQLLPPDDIKAITDAGLMVFHDVGDTGDERGRQQDFVAAMMTQDYQTSVDNLKPAFCYHLGDVVYFAGDVDMYGANFYETYKDYPAYIVAIPGNHDCQPDDPQDGPIDPHKVPLDGWVQNFMSKDATQLGSLKTSSGRTQMDLPNVYWTFTTPLATIIGLFSNVGENEGEIHQDQINWFKGELSHADPNLALIVTVHHPPFSGDTEHSGSTAVYNVLFDSFKATGRYPDLILSGHVHAYQRFTTVVQGPKGPLQIPCIVNGAGGYTRLSPLHKINGAAPSVPLQLGNGLTLEQYDEENFGFLRLEVSKTQILGIYYSDHYVAGGTPKANAVERFVVDLVKKTVRTL
jgi:calcineurin-like phosphoesterase family protein